MTKTKCSLPKKNVQRTLLCREIQGRSPSGSHWQVPKKCVKIQNPLIRSTEEDTPPT